VARGEITITLQYTGRHAHSILFMYVYKHMYMCTYMYITALGFSHVHNNVMVFIHATTFVQETQL